MTYKEFVNRPARLKRRIEHKIEDVQLKWTICQATTGNTDGERVQNSVTNGTENSLFRYIEAKQELDKLAGELEQARSEVRIFLYSNLPERDASMLEWMYIDGKTLSEIADIVSASYYTVRNRTNAANKSLRLKYEQNVKIGSQKC